MHQGKIQVEREMCLSSLRGEKGECVKGDIGRPMEGAVRKGTCGN